MAMTIGCLMMALPSNPNRRINVVKRAINDSGCNVLKTRSNTRVPAFSKAALQACDNTTGKTIDSPTEIRSVSPRHCYGRKPKQKPD